MDGSSDLPAGLMTTVAALGRQAGGDGGATQRGFPLRGGGDTAQAAD